MAKRCMKENHMDLVLSDRNLDSFRQRHPTIQFIDLSSLNIANCVDVLAVG